MVHFCIFGGHGGELSGTHKLFVTLFGGCELRRPTIAKQLIEMRQRGGQNLPKRNYVFITVFGGAELKMPTLAEEFIELREALQAGVLTLRDWDQAVAQINSGDMMKITSFTMFGGFDGALPPDEDEELDRLALHQHLGTIPPTAVDMLMPAAGQGGAQRPAVVRQAMAAALAASA